MAVLPLRSLAALPVLGRLRKEPEATFLSMPDSISHLAEDGNRNEDAGHIPIDVLPQPYR